jgi:hypothetical protein
MVTQNRFIDSSFSAFNFSFLTFVGLRLACSRTSQQEVNKLEFIKVFYLPTDAQEICFKKNIRIYIKTAPTCFAAITTIRDRIIRAC